jgi:hypothetical protein
VAFNAEQKRAHRAKPEVRQREREYKADWDRTNREQRAEYQRRYRRGRAGSGSTTTPRHQQQLIRAICLMLALPKNAFGSFLQSPSRGGFARRADPSQVCRMKTPLCSIGYSDEEEAETR